MNEPINLPDQSQLLSSVRALLAAVQQPLGALEETLQTPEQLLVELAPPLAVVDFSPFAQLTVPAAESRQTAPKPPLRSAGSPPVATTWAAATSQPSLSPPPTQPPTQSTTGPQTSLMSALTKTVTPPVFSLPNQKRTASVGASSLGRRDASPDHSVAPISGALATAVTGNTMSAADRNDPLSAQWYGEQAMPAIAQMAPEQVLQPGTLPISSEATAAPSLATMSLLATVVDSLLAAAPTRVEPVAGQGASATGAASVPVAPLPPTGDGLQWPANLASSLQSLLPANSSNLPSNEKQPMATPPIRNPAADPAARLTGWPSVTDENQSPNLGLNSGRSQLTNQPTPDPWTLAQLINDVLAEEARRHGVDLS